MRGSVLARVQRWSACYDLLAAAVFAFPFSAAWDLQQLQELHQRLGLSGAFPRFEPMNLLFVNLFGGFVVVWSVLRLLRPEPVLGLCDGVLRLFFASLMLHYLGTHSVTTLLVAFCVAEMVWGSLQLVLFVRSPAEARAIAPAAGQTASIG